MLSSGCVNPSYSRLFWSLFQAFLTLVFSFFLHSLYQTVDTKLQEWNGVFPFPAALNCRLRSLQHTKTCPKVVICLFRKGTSHPAVAIKWGPFSLQNPKISISKIQLQNNGSHGKNPKASSSFMLAYFVIWLSYGLRQAPVKETQHEDLAGSGVQAACFAGMNYLPFSSPFSPVTSYLTEQGCLKWTNEDPIAFSSSRTAC